MAGVVSNNVYNHFASEYVAKDITSADMHKKDELRDVYKSIAKINKESPLYLIKQDDNAQDDAIAIKEQSRSLQGDLVALNSEDDKNLFSKAAYTTNEYSVSAQYLGKLVDAQGNDNLPSFQINVKKLATPQINSGAVVSNTGHGLDPGSYAFYAKVNGTQYEFQYDVTAKDNNRTIQDRLARLITKSNIGLDAQVINDSEGFSYMRITSLQTGLALGQDRQFSFFETEDPTKSGTVNLLGMDDIARDATNAEFTLNGAERSSVSNKFSLGNDFNVTLHAPSGNEDVTIGLKNDNESLLQHVHTLTQSYNKFLDNIKDMQHDKFKGNHILREFKSVAEEYLNDLDTYGINIDDEGKIKIDEDKLGAYRDDETLSEKLKPLRQFSDALVDKTKQISVDPMKYVDRPIVNYKNPSNPAFQSPYITSEYSGMIFSGYC